MAIGAMTVGDSHNGKFHEYPGAGLPTGWRPGTLGLNYWRRCDGADLNQSIEWDAVIVNDHPNHLIA